MAKIENGKVTITKVEINVADIMAWLKKENRWVKAVQVRDAFHFPLRQTFRVLARLLEAEKKVVIIENPNRKKSYLYSATSLNLKPPKAKETKATKARKKKAVKKEKVETEEIPVIEEQVETKEPIVVKEQVTTEQPSPTKKCENCGNNILLESRSVNRLRFGQN